MSNQDQSQEDSGSVWLGACDMEHRWQGGLQYDSLKVGLSLPIRVPRKLYDEALDDEDPVGALERLYRRFIQMHSRLVREEVHRAAIPVLENMGRMTPNLTQMVAGLEAVDGDASAGISGTVGISQIELDRLRNELAAAIEKQRQPKQE